jgi:nicotinamide riboside transporter PnuC
MSSSLIDVLNYTALTLLGTPLSYAECFGFATGIVCVWLTARRNIWIVATGTIEQRVDQCLAWTDRKLATAWRFGEPLK